MQKIVYMDLTLLIEIFREFGPIALMFIIGIWSVYNMNKTNKDERKRLSDREDQLLNTVLLALDKRDQEKRVEHDLAAEHRKKVIRECNDIVKDILEKTGADHVAIYDYCNGTHSLAGVPFLHFRVLAEKSFNGMIRTLHDKVDMNVFGVFLIDLEQEQIRIIKNVKKEEERYPELVRQMTLQKQTKGIYANLVGKNSSLGFLSVTFSQTKKVDYEQLEKIVFKNVQKISTLLDYNN